MKCFFPFKSRESKSTSELRNRNQPAPDRRAKSSGSESSPSPSPLPPPPPPNVQQMYRERGQNLKEFSFSELRAATYDFSNFLKIGEGGFGSVYKGTIGALDGRDHPTVVAIKKLNKRGLQGHKQWLAEVQFLGIVEHPNLVKLLGYCSIDRERGLQRLLVYEYMPNKSLEDQLFTRTSSTLTWKTRLDIMLGAARGLTYLHEGLEVQVIFRDFKSSNVLLDADFKPKLSDFGLAREGPIGDRSHVSTDVVGTIGYAAPEYVKTGHLTVKSDIYSFGVVLYEILTGRRAIERFRPPKEQKLLDWVKDFPVHSNMFSMIIDPRIRSQCSLTSASKIAMLADRCLNKIAKDRPTMQEVIGNLEEVVLQDSEAGSSSEVSSSKRPLAHEMRDEDIGRKPSPLPQPRDSSVRG